MRSKKAIANVITSFFLQIIVAVCGFIVPRYVLSAFGSEVNGLVSSITQFLGYIALVEGGIGGVTRAALYKPLAQKDNIKLSGIIKATESFFRKLALAFIAYTFVLSILYPLLVKTDFEWFFTFSLIVILSTSTFAQYFFGIAYQLLVNADQKKYVTNIIQIVTTILNTVLVVLLIKLDCSIHIVKLASAIVFILRPLAYRFYVKASYKLVQCGEDKESIHQRWDGLGHHIAFYIHKNTDIVVLTIFTNILEVSVYSIYNTIVISITNIVKIFSSGVESAFGNMISKGEDKALIKNFKIFDFIISVITVSIFTVAGILILPFIKLYVKGVVDVNYIRPVFGIMIIIAEAIYCLRLPYQSIALAAGKYKETRNGAFGEALINIVLSVILVNYFGIVGIAIGTCLAMMFRTVQYATFTCKYILKIRMQYLFKRSLINILCVFCTLIIVKMITISEIDTYYEWFFAATIISILSFFICIIINCIFFNSEFKDILTLTKNIIASRSNK